MPDPCRSCDRRELDFGGCRCQAFQLTGDAARTDPVCHLSPDHGIVAYTVQAANEGERPRDAALIPRPHRVRAMADQTIVGILVLAFTLSLDNFRSSVAIGTVPFSLRRAVQIALIFGLWDTLAPLVGGLIGHYFGAAIGPIADYVGPAVMGSYGLYILVGAVRNPEPDELDHPWVTLLGMPLSLSVDNLLAGAGLGLLGFSPVIPAVIFGVVTAAVSFAGLCLGRVAARAVRIRSDLMSGVSLIAAAIVLPIVFA